MRTVKIKKIRHTIYVRKVNSELLMILTSHDGEFPHFYKWRDESRGLRSSDTRIRYVKKSHFATFHGIENAGFSSAKMNFFWKNHAYCKCKALINEGSGESPAEVFVEADIVGEALKNGGEQMLSPVTFHMAAKYNVDEKKLDDKTRTFLYTTWGCTRKVYNLYVDWYYSELEKAGYQN